MHIYMEAYKVVQSVQSRVWRIRAIVCIGLKRSEALNVANNNKIFLK